MKDPVITICIRTYNRAHFLEKSISSALAQHGLGTEVLVVDDGSTDHTQKLMRRFIKQGVRYLFKNHTNASDTANRAIKEAKGKFILWLDSDDELLPGVVHRFNQVLKEYPDVDICYGDKKIIGDAGDFTGNIVSTNDYFRKNDDLLARMVYSNRIPMTGTFIRKNLYQRIGGYDVSFQRSHDYEFYARAVTTAVFKHIGMVTALWRWHGGNMSPCNRSVDRSNDALVLSQLVSNHSLERLFSHLPWNRRRESLLWSHTELARLFHMYQDVQSAVHHFEQGYALLYPDQPLPDHPPARLEELRKAHDRLHMTTGQEYFKRTEQLLSLLAKPDLEQTGKFDEHVGNSSSPEQGAVKFSLDQYSKSIILDTSFHSFPGCAYGLRQTTLTGRIRLCQNEITDHPELDQVLREATIKALDRPCTACFQPQSSDPEQALTARILFWATALQRHAGLPVHESGRIAAINQLPGGWVEYEAALPYYLRKEAAQSLMLVVETLNDLAFGGKLRPETETMLSQGLQAMAKAEPLGSMMPYFLDTAHQLGIAWRKLTGNIFEFGYGARSRWLVSTITDETSWVGTAMARNKRTTAQTLHRYGLPVPRHAQADSPDHAVQIARELGFPVVVKPMDLDAGIAVAAGLVSEEAVRKAFDKAREKSPNVLVEKHHPGNDYRLAVLHGEVFLVGQRIPGGVVGDGQRTVAKLLDALNADPRRGNYKDSILKTLKYDDEARTLLEEAGLTSDSVPENGRFIRLRRAANISSGGTPVDVTGKAHPDNIRLAIQAASALRLDLAGVDLLMPDIEQSWLETEAVICEVNAHPQLLLALDAQQFTVVLKKLLHGDGRIPIFLVIGSKLALDVGIVLQQHLQLRHRCVGRASKTGAWLGMKRVSKSPGFLSILVNKEVEAAVLIADPQELLTTGLPFDSCDIVILVEGPEKQATDADTNHARFEQMCRMVLPHARTGIIANDNDPSCRDCAALKQTNPLWTSSDPVLMAETALRLST
ncbi:D-alanine-D-alanine ligase [Desulfonatronum zhilinae]|nr:D-alanine-D-alanine ligase [Desulfonatronum zhilinae]